MARYTGPKLKISRRFGEPVMGPSKVLRKKNYPPGQHGKGRKKRSAYADQLREKQKAKYTYGILERQFFNAFKKAAAQKGVTGENLFRLLESRLDSVVFRLGVRRTQRAARQLVTHGHVRVNGRKVNIPSYQVAINDVITIKPSSEELRGAIQDDIKSHAHKYAWLAFDADKLIGKFIQLPEREAIPENINEQVIVELYSK